MEQRDERRRARSNSGFGHGLFKFGRLLDNIGLEISMTFDISLTQYKLWLASDEVSTCSLLIKVCKQTLHLHERVDTDATTKLHDCRNARAELGERGIVLLLGEASHPCHNFERQRTALPRRIMRPTDSNLRSFHDETPRALILPTKIGMCTHRETCRTGVTAHDPVTVAGVAAHTRNKNCLTKTLVGLAKLLGLSQNGCVAFRRGTCVLWVLPPV